MGGWFGELIYKSKRSVNEQGEFERKIDLYNLRVSGIKALLYKKMNNGELISLKKWRDGKKVEEKFYDEIRAEHMVKSPRTDTVKFILPSGVANHALDCFVYAYAALKYIPVRWDLMRKRYDEERAQLLAGANKKRGKNNKSAKSPKS